MIAARQASSIEKMRDAVPRGDPVIIVSAPPSAFMSHPFQKRGKPGESAPFFGYHAIAGQPAADNSQAASRRSLRAASKRRATSGQLNTFQHAPKNSAFRF